MSLPTTALYLLPPLDLGFRTRLEAIEEIVKDEQVTFPNEMTSGIDHVFVAGDTIVDCLVPHSYSLRHHMEWLSGHITRAAKAKPATPARQVYTPINLPSKAYAKVERLEMLINISDRDDSGRDVIKFDEGDVLYDACRIVGDQVVTSWQRGSGYRIETECDWLRNQIAWEERQANRPAFQPQLKKASRSCHPGKQGLKETPWWKRSSEEKADEKVAKVTTPAAAPKPPALNTGKATEVGAQILREKRLALRKQIEEQIEAAIEANDEQLFEKLTGEIEKRVTSLVLTDKEIIAINHQAMLDEQAARRRDPNFGAQKKVAPKADKKAKDDSKKDDKKNRRAA